MEHKIERASRLPSHQSYKRLMKRYYMQAKYARLVGKKVVWLTSGAPVEFVYAIGAIPVYPENHGAICGATKMGPELCQVAEGAGYSQDLCSYMRCDIGSSLSGKSPINGLPRPDFLICCNNICSTVLKWFEIQGRFYNVPLFVLDTPFVHSRTSQHTIDYITAQMEQLITFLEKCTRKRFKLKKLSRVVARANEGTGLWRDILEFNRHRPAPITCFDAFVYMAPIVTLRGTAKMNRFYRQLKNDLQQRIDANVGAINEERIRLLWDNIPIWYEMRNLSKLLMSFGANLVVDTYTTAWSFGEFNYNKPLESLAENYTNVYLNAGLKAKMESIVEKMEEFATDGFIMHSNRSCKPYSLGQYDIKRQITKKSGKPGLIIDADMTDSRSFFSAQTKTKINAFIEML